jgi:type II secretory pathway pseudopilin PulG
LIELLCAIAIVAILVALSLAAFPKAIDKAKKLETRQKNFNNWMTNDGK